MTAPGNRLSALTRDAIRAARVALAAALVFTLWQALKTSDALSVQMWDKALHAFAFYTLALLASGAFPRVRLRYIGGGLLAFGLLIEALQKLPFVHRDASWADWFADGVGIALALVPIALERARQALD